MNVLVLVLVLFYLDVVSTQGGAVGSSAGVHASAGAEPPLSWKKTTESRKQTADIRQQAAGSRQQTADSRQQTAGSRQQTADSRQQTADK